MSRDVGINPNDFCLPDLGEGLEEAELLEWCVQTGQTVRENDVLAKMETAKALVEVPSPRDGVIAVLHGKAGDMIKTGAPLVTYRDGAEQEAAGLATPGKETPEEERTDAGTVVGSLGGTTEGVGGDKVRAAPAVRRLARELGVDLSRVTGTGIGGRITGRDVETQAQAKGEDGRGQEVDPDAGASKHAEENPGSTPTRQTASSPPSASSPVRTAFRGIRRTIAQRLRHSINQAVHFTVMDEADVTALEVLRRKLAAASNEKLSLLPFVAAAVCQLLAGDIEPRFGVLNSTVDDEQEEILRHRAVHLGIATDTDNGLMVPVLRDARQLGVLEIARKIAGLAHGARHRTLATADLAGSTFTLSNFGAVAGRFATPIINYPEVAILAIGRARDGVIVRDGMLGVGKLLPLSLAADHRVVDGATASAALEAIIQLLQNPQELLAGAKDLRT